MKQRYSRLKGRRGRESVGDGWDIDGEQRDAAQPHIVSSIFI